MFDITPGTLFIYYCGYEQCLPGHAFGPAVRPHYLIHLVLNGCGIYKCGNETYTLNAGDAFLISPVESTLYKADDRRPWEYAWVGFDGTQVEDLLAQTCFRNSCIWRGSTRTSPDNNAADLLLSMVRCFHKPDHSPLTLNGLFLQLLGTMHCPPSPDGKESSRQYLQLALKYMKHNFGYHIKISDIAASIGIDRTYLYRIFMKEEQLSPKQYLLRLRVRSAANMLSSTPYTVTEIAFSCGFQDAASFCSQFKKQTGFTPTGYREYMKKEVTYGAR